MFSYQTVLVSTLKQTSYFKTKGLVSSTNFDRREHEPKGRPNVYNLRNSPSLAMKHLPQHCVDGTRQTHTLPF